MIEIRETSAEDLENVRRLWADGDVMRYVGFPDGLHHTDEEMRDWLKWITANSPDIKHYSVYEDCVYCGEAFYEIDREHDSSAALDIKLFRFARGRGIASQALSYTIEEAFRNGAESVWVDPVPQNEKAIALYSRLGFRRKEMPEHLLTPGKEPVSVYMELREDQKLSKEKGLGVLITDHNPKATLSITDRAYVIFDGKIKIQGNSADVAVDPVAKEFYLGKDFTL